MGEHAREFTDTSPEAMKVWIEIIRSKTVGERMEMVFRLTELALQMQEAGMRERYPEASDREIFLRCAALRIPRDLMIKVYGWDPLEYNAACIPPSGAM